ncbi:CaiB/BaiF CoA transferase family protein [Chelatococcus sp. GCM10030263]|uniref:CaiB/BaiF CoA transferase family protein n=1 Tax=Chelatococcus sp. GCM10030263 TaxID=3273387 RepID=UPI003622651D
MADGSGQGLLPLAGYRVLEFGHTVMGPVAGLVLADLGADVVKIEPAPNGDTTRQLRGFGSGFFGYFNRNKKSLALDLKTHEGRTIIGRLVADADVVIENFGVGTMERLGCGYDDFARINPRLVYCALKGFLPGPYEKRAALDEVVQYMGGLAYMTGLPGRPLRAGSSVIDITGGLFGVIAILAALKERERTGKGQLVKSALFESTAFLMGQHMAASAMTQEKILPMSQRRSAWSIYRTFETGDGDQLFIGIVSDKQWARFCAAFQRPDLAADPRLDSNQKRIAEGEWLLPLIAEILKARGTAEICALCDDAGIAYAPVAEVEDLFDDPHLRAGGGLLDVTLPGGIRTRLPRLPVAIGAHSLGLRREAPAMGEHNREILAELGMTDEEIAALEKHNVIART